MEAHAKPPYNKKQLKNLKRFQRDGRVHPFTCRGQHCNRAGRKDQGILIPTPEGMICPCGKYMQDWVHNFMTTKRVGKGYWNFTVPLLGNVAFSICVKWRHDFQNFTIPWFGVKFEPKRLSSKKLPGNGRRTDIDREDEGIHNRA